MAKNDYIGIYKYIGNSIYSKNGKIDKNKIFNLIIRYMLARTNQIFEYENLPDTIPKRILELYLQTNGYTCFAKNGDNLYVYFGGFGGVPDEYYMPTKFIVANPYQELNKTFDINENCVIMKNDTMFQGLMPILEKYAHLLTENYVSMNVANINSRITSILTAKNEAQKAAADEYIKKIKDGEMSVILDGMDLLGTGVETKPFTSSTGSAHLTDLIEFEQYLKASLYNELGLQSNYNMKREAINAAEGQLNEDALKPFVDDMLACRKEGIEQVNKMFGTNIEVKLSSSWAINEKEIEIELEQMEEIVENEKEEKEVVIDDRIEDNE